MRGTAISIRKFSAKPITLDMMAGFGSMSPKMATALKIAGACRFNIVISGGTGSGKTTMLNALSKMIDPGERVLTIEDAAELRLQQPHWLPLETRPANLEGQGAITHPRSRQERAAYAPGPHHPGRNSRRRVFRHARRDEHRPRRLDVYAPRQLPARGARPYGEHGDDVATSRCRRKRSAARSPNSVDLIVQVKRLRDGSRRVTNITEVIGMEGDVIVTQELFKFEYLDESADGKIIGEYRSMGLRPYTLEKARQFGFDQAYLEACL